MATDEHEKNGLEDRTKWKLDLEECSAIPRQLEEHPSRVDHGENFPLPFQPDIEFADRELGWKCVIGLYASGQSTAINTVESKPFSCADNSAAKAF